MDLKELIINLDSANIQKLYESHRQAIFLFAFGITKDYHMSEDITEEVFIRIIKYHKTYNRFQNPKTWIFTIARNTTYTMMKKNKEVPCDNDVLENFLSQHNKVKNDDSLVVEEYLSYLTDDERNIVILRIFGGLNCLEISKILKMSHSTVRSKYSYSLKKLRRIIEENER